MIDFDMIAAAYSAGFAAQTHGWATLFDKMDKLLDGLLERSDAAERATRAYPVLRYRDGAIGVRLSLGPQSLFGDLDGASRSLGQGLSDGAQSFVSGLGQIGAMGSQELALPREASVLADMAAVVDASMARFEQASAAMFDARSSRFSDIFGLAGLGWRALQGEANQDQLRGAAFRFGLGAQFLGSLSSGSSSTGGASTGAAGAGDLMAARLDESAELVMGALLLLPAAGLAVDLLVESQVLSVQDLLLQEFDQVESRVYTLRDDLVDAWLMAFDVGTTLHYLTSAASLVLWVDSALLAGAMPVWLNGLLDGTAEMLTGIGAWGIWTSAMIDAFQVATTDLMAVDLMPWVIRNVLGDWLADHVPAPTITLDMVVRLVTGEGNLAMRDDLDHFFSAADDALWLADKIPGVDVSGIRAKAAALSEIFHLTLSPTPFTYPPDVPPTGPLAAFPDVYAAMFGGSGRADLLGAVAHAGTELQASLHDIGAAGQDLAAGLASTAETEMGRQSRAGAGLALRQRWASEGTVVSALVQPLRADLLAAQAGAPAEPMADALDHGMADASRAGAILASTQAIPAYVQEMRRFWSARSTQRDYPTSAHILARSGRLAMVEVPRLTLTAYERAADQDLVTQVAGGFHGVVLDAYRQGRDRLAVLAATPGGARRGR
jgi:hypothetical protein